MPSATIRRASSSSNPTMPSSMVAVRRWAALKASRWVNIAGRASGLAERRRHPSKGTFHLTEIPGFSFGNLTGESRSSRRLQHAAKLVPSRKSEHVTGEAASVAKTAIRQPLDMLLLYHDRHREPPCAPDVPRNVSSAEDFVDVFQEYMALVCLKWCRGGDSNPHAREELRCLRPMRLPVPPPRPAHEGR